MIGTAVRFHFRATALPLVGNRDHCELLVCRAFYGQFDGDHAFAFLPAGFASEAGEKLGTDSERINFLSRSGHGKFPQKPRLLIR